MKTIQIFDYQADIIEKIIKDSGGLLRHDVDVIGVLLCEYFESRLEDIEEVQRGIIETRYDASRTKNH